MSRKAATIRSKTEERKRRRDLVRTLAILPNDVTFLTGRYEALKRDPARPADARMRNLRFLPETGKNDGVEPSSKNAEVIQTGLDYRGRHSASPPLRMTDRGLYCVTWSHRIKPQHRRGELCSPVRGKERYPAPFWEAARVSVAERAFSLFFVPPAKKSEKSRKI